MKSHFLNSKASRVKKIRGYLGMSEYCFGYENTASWIKEALLGGSKVIMASISGTLEKSAAFQVFILFHLKWNRTKKHAVQGRPEKTGDHLALDLEYKKYFSVFIIEGLEVALTLTDNKGSGVKKLSEP